MMELTTATILYAGLIAIVPTAVYRYYTRRTWQNAGLFGLSYIGLNLLVGIITMSFFPENLIISMTPQDYAARVAIGGIIAYAIYYVLLTQVEAFKARDRVWKIFTTAYVMTILAKMIVFLYVSAALNAGLMQSLMNAGGF